MLRGGRRAAGLRPRRPTSIRLDEPNINDRFAEHRRAVDTSERRLVEICDDEHLQLAVDHMYYFRHWITPEGAPRRYDTRFFVAAAPEAQVPLHDDHEVIANLWIRPTDALARHRAGEFDLIFPTIRSLETLERFASADDVLAAAAAIGDVPTILPRIVEDQGGDAHRAARRPRLRRDRAGRAAAGHPDEQAHHAHRRTTDGQ